MERILYALISAIPDSEQNGKLEETFQMYSSCVLVSFKNWKASEKLEVISMWQINKSILLELIWQFLVKFYINELSNEWAYI